MSLRPSAIAEERSGMKGLYVVIDDPDTAGVLLIPCSFEHRRVLTREQYEAEGRFEIHPSQDAATQPEAEQGEGERPDIYDDIAALDASIESARASLRRFERSLSEDEARLDTSPPDQQEGGAEPERTIPANDLRNYCEERISEADSTRREPPATEFAYHHADGAACALLVLLHDFDLIDEPDTDGFEPEPASEGGADHG